MLYIIWLIEIIRWNLRHGLLKYFKNNFKSLNHFIIIFKNLKLFKNPQLKLKYETGLDWNKLLII